MKDIPGDPVLAAEMPSDLGRYELLFPIASGGMAKVYAARLKGEAGFEKLVAIKRMLPSLAESDEFMMMFYDEGRLAANITSPHVVSTLDLGRGEDGAPFIAMDFVLGLSLAQMRHAARHSGGLVPMPIAVQILAQAALGLHHAHEATTVGGAPLGIIHRDVSPQNILIGADGRARITDFGVARAVYRFTRTTTGQMKGKLGYCSPEQVRGETVDRRTDVFALGVVAWELLSGESLFRSDHPVNTMHRVLSGDVPALPGVPLAVFEVLTRALKQERDDRTKTCAEFAEELRDAARDTVGLATEQDIAAYVRDVAPDRIGNLQQMLRASAVNSTEALTSDPTGQRRSLTPHLPGELAESVAELEVRSSLARSRRIRRYKVAGTLAAAIILGIAFALMGRDPDASVEPRTTDVPIVASEPPASEDVTPTTDEANSQESAGTDVMPLATGAAETEEASASTEAAAPPARQARAKRGRGRGTRSSTQTAGGAGATAATASATGTRGDRTSGTGPATDMGERGTSGGYDVADVTAFDQALQDRR